MTQARISVFTRKIALPFMVATTIFMTSPFILAEPRIDYDLDNDGLIEINDLQDLDEIRNNHSQNRELLGQTLYEVSDGCPTEGCNGYELTTDLNFDTNGNNIFDEGDTYWNEGLGWLPIGFGGYKFSSNFNGNGHTLHNLVIRRPGQGFVGLFSDSEIAHLHDFNLKANIIASNNSAGVVGHSWQTRFENLNVDVIFTANNGGIDCVENICGPEHVGGVVGSGNESIFKNIAVNAHITGINGVTTPGVLGGLAGSIMGSSVEEVAAKGSVTGSTAIGGIAGFVQDSTIESVVVTSQVNGTSSVGGVIGRAADTSLENVLVSGTLLAGIGINKYASGGGLIGLADSGVTVSGVVSLVRLLNTQPNAHYIGALIGSVSSPSINNVYWASDLAVTQPYGSTEGGAQTFDLTDLQCATNENPCNGLQYTGYNAHVNSNGQPLWQFGSNEQAPQMTLASGTYGDIDGNGEMDNWPQINGPDGQNPVDNDLGGAKSDAASTGLGGLLYILCLLLPVVLRRR